MSQLILSPIVADYIHRVVFNKKDRIPFRSRCCVFRRRISFANLCSVFQWLCSIPRYRTTAFPLVCKHGRQESTADNVLFVNIFLVSSKCLFEVWLFNKGMIDDKIAIIAMRWRISGKNVPTSNAQQICIASLHLCRRLVAHILMRFWRIRLQNSPYLCVFKYARGVKQKVWSEASLLSKSPRFSLLVGYNIQPSSSSTNQNAALIIDH